MGATGSATASAGSRKLRIFISHASEDLNLACTISGCLKNALGEFPDINLDKWFMQLGKDFRAQLQDRLQESDILIIVFTGLNKSYTGWEIGFWEALSGLRPGTEEDPAYQKKRLIPLYLGTPPEVVSSYQGVDLSIPQALLQLDYDKFAAQDVITADDPICKFIQDLQDTADDYRKAAGWRKLEKRPDPIEAARQIRLEVFRSLKCTVSEERKVQQQITVQLPRPLGREATQLPPDSRLIPAATGAPDIAGLPNQEITWDAFGNLPGPYQRIWSDALSTIVLSYLQGSIDNSQVLVLPSALAGGHPVSYRLILTRVTKYYDDRIRFELYVVQSLDPEAYGDQDTTQVLKGLEIICRYRFMFLEKTSKFAWYNIVLAAPDQAQSDAYELRRELDLMRRDALRAGLDRPATWVPYMDITELQKMGEIYPPSEQKMRDLITAILQATGPDQIKALQQQLSDTIRQVAAVTEPINASLIIAMSQSLQSLIKQQRDAQAAAAPAP
ncbi:MAG: toll/interleukin-1 receptor domain-containing protein [Candidatus Korobacteraceae bacterium]